MMGKGWTHIDWSVVNWRLRNCEIAALLGCSHQAVSLARIRLRKPDALRRGRPRNSAGERALRLDWKSLKGASLARLAKALGVGTNRARQIATEFGFPIPRPARIHKPEQWNWDLPTRDLAVIWMGAVTASTQAQVARFRRSPRRWDAHRKDLIHNKAYNAALRRERSKAART